ncbi:MAG TPA: Ig-like domain-containing protein [Terriglobales bacterium]
MRKVLLAAAMVAFATLTGCSGGGSSSTNSSSSSSGGAVVSSIQVAPQSMSIGAGATQQFKATAQMSDGSTKDVTTSVQWNSSDSTIASISTIGMATGSNSGTVTITALSGTLKSSASLTVTSAAANLTSIAISPAASSIAVHTSQQFTATGTYSDGSSADLTSLVTWASSSTGVATIDASGLASALNTGSTNISASLGGVSQSTSLTITAPTIVSIAVTPVGLTLGIGINQQFVATATYSDGSSADLTSAVTWGTSASSVASINSSGLTTTVAAGQTTITARLGGFSDSTTLTVVAAHLVSIAVNPAVQTIAAGTTLQFTAIGSFDDGSTQLLQSVTWSAAPTSVASVDATGMVSGVGTGTATITATSGSVSGTASLTVSGATLVSIAVTPINSSMAVGTTKQFTATGTYSDSSTQDVTASVIWTSSTPAAAAINAQGLASSIATGTTTITASFGSITGSTGLTVSTAHLVSIAITPANPRINVGTSLKFTASGTFSDGSVAANLSGVSWKSSKPNIASVRSSGIAHGKKGGSVTITASASGVSGTTTLTVGTGTLSSIAVTPATPTASAGTTQQFAATGTFSDGSTQDVTLNAHWSSSSASIATVANAPSLAGLAHCIAAGSSNIGANSGGITNSTVLTVQ